MKDTLTKPFLRVLAFDACMLCCVIAMFGFGWNIWFGLIFVAVVVWGGKAIKAILPTLDVRQVKVRFGGQVGAFLLMIALVLRWALRVNDGAAWGMSSMAFIVLLALLYAEWDTVSDELKVRANNQTSANQSAEPTSASGTSPAGQEPRLP